MKTRDRRTDSVPNPDHAGPRACRTPSRRTRLPGFPTAALFALVLGLVPAVGVATRASAGPTPWPTAPPAEASLDPAALARFSDYTGGRGCVVRGGRLVYGWGDITRRGDVASACKPVFTHFLLLALAEGRIPSLEAPILPWEPRLANLNPELGHKDRAITWRHFATQTSCYGLVEAPGTAFAYNDWSMALFIDLLFPRVYGVPWAEVDTRLLHPLLTDPLGCEDDPSLVGMGLGDRAGRLAISPRDFARFGQLYLHGGRWSDRPLLREDLVWMAIGSPLPATLPRAGTNAASLIPGQRTLGSRRLPDNQTEHFGSYSFLWWVNGLERDGRRHWPDAPTNTFAALGHGGLRALWVLPSLDLICSWNDARVESPAMENEALRLLVAATRSAPPPAPASPAPPASPPSPSTGPAADPQPVRPPASLPPSARDPSRRRLAVETDAGGDPDDEQSLVRFLLYANEWDLEVLVANRPHARDGENRNPERTGLGIVRRLLDAYRQVWPELVRHDPRYPAPDTLRARTVAGYDTVDDAVNALIAAVDAPDPRPLWYSDWGSDRGSATNNLRRALDRVRRERDPEGYARFKGRLRLVSGDAFGRHSTETEPPFRFWADTWRPELDGRRWYHRFSPIIARAGGFDLARDCLTGHGPLGALYPTNTTQPQKEGDTLSFLYLVPNGLNTPEQPGWGGWGGRLGPDERFPGQPRYWANQADTWNGTTHRDNTLLRWAADLQNDFRARLDWCVPAPHPANHPPVVRLDSPGRFTIAAGERRTISAADSRDPDGDRLAFEWIPYPEAGEPPAPATSPAPPPRAPLRLVPHGASLTLEAPAAGQRETHHLILRVTDSGQPPLSRYARVLVDVASATPPLARLAPLFEPPPAYAGRLGDLRPVLRFDDGRPVTTPADWAVRRAEIRGAWERLMGPWPPAPETNELAVLAEDRPPGESHLRRRVRVTLAPGLTGEGWLLIPDPDPDPAQPRPRPHPAVLVVYYEPETSLGLNPRQHLRDFGLQLARRGFVTLSIGTPGGDAWKPELANARCQPLSFHAFVAANAWRALAGLPEVDPARIGVTGHSYGGKWALFAAALWERFAAVAVSDPGILFDESRPNVNYWEPWYLGRDPEKTRRPGLPAPDNARTGAYARLVEQHHDLHEILALLAPRPLLVSGGAEDPPERWLALNHLAAVNRLLGVSNRVAYSSRPTHDPTGESNDQLYAFFEHFLASPP